ncbi:hypothetical protein N7517_002655 [Penicillium concentricum]|uniref:Ubiquitin-like protease family profile domain-containing protein n=1 Tax=Penicillium concentricum TaxID=293559 RepID=A0A9W9VKW5_9EURO|nr:uncharacterized protein N7517_002655 [Penicillium concentricum]KAJ5384744.1 hypothetical protein N7517_002655 [Penicillium concentricum]
MLSQVYLLLLLLLSSWVAASPALPNPRSYPQPTPHPSPLEKRDDGDVTFPASRCDSPCIVNFFPVTTVLTISAPTQTVWVSIFKEFVTFNFPAITTSTVLQPSAQTFINNDPVATPTITLSPAEVGVLTIFGNEDTHAYHHYESIAMFLNYMVVDDGPVEYRELQYTQYNLNNDCALITMAYLMEISLQDLLTYTGLAPPGADRDGLFPAEIQLWLHHTGRNYAQVHRNFPFGAR